MQWHVERQGEMFYRQAKESGYRARSAYKLLDIQNKFHVIKKSDIVVDLGAAPGSWSQVALEIVGSDGVVFGVDVQPVIGLGKNFKFIRADIIKNREKIISEIKHTDVILSDISPEFAGTRVVDFGIAMELAYCSLEIAKGILSTGGSFVCKVFQSHGQEEFVKEAKKNFEEVKLYKPKASQKGSTEIYAICLKLKKVKQN